MNAKNNWLGGWAIFIAATLLVALAPTGVTVAQSAGWSPPFRLSLDGLSWFPDIAADATGRVHVIWSADTLDYRFWENGGWSPMSEIAIAPDATGKPIVDVFRAAIATDAHGHLNLIYYHLTEGIGFFTRALAQDAGNFRAWGAPQPIGAHGQGYYTALATDKKEQLHVVYVNTSLESKLAEVFYRRSENAGTLWTLPENLSNSPRVGSSRPQISMDQFDIVHVVWDEGWDRRSGEGTAQNARYIFSTTGGRDWSVPATFGAANRPVAQLAVMSANTPDSRVAVWRTTTDEAVYYQTSNDSGKTWSAFAPIPGILPRLWNSPPFDQYHLVRDARGIVHLLLVTRRATSADLWAVTHLEWNGKEWSRPEIIFEREGLYPEYPRATVALGNQLHVVWFARSALFSIAPMNVWHSYKTLDAPRHTPAPVTPTATPLPPPPTSTPTPAPTRVVPPGMAEVEPLPNTDLTAFIPMVIGVVAGGMTIGVALWLRHQAMRRD